MSKILKVSCCIVAVFCASAMAQDTARMFWVPEDGDETLYSSGATVIYASQGEQVCTEVWVQGIGSAYDSKGVEAFVEDGAICTGSGTIDADCSTVAIDTGHADDSGFVGNTQATQNCGSLGTGTEIGWLRAFIAPTDFTTLPLNPDGAYMAEVCYDVSGDMCGCCTINYLDLHPATPTRTRITDFPGGNTQTDAIFDVLMICNVPLCKGMPHDDCADACAVGSETVAYDLACATTDGTECTTDDVWYLYTADCTGDLTITADDGTIGLYGPGATCVPSSNIDCGNPVTTVVATGETYLVQLGDGTAGDITFDCEAFCTTGLPAGHATTIAECGPPDTPGDDPCLMWYCGVTGCESVYTDPGDPGNTTDGTVCDDGLWCTINDACDLGVCVGPDQYDCTDPSGCSADFCVEGAPGHCDNVPYNSYGYLCPGGDVSECATVTDDYGAVVQATDCVAGECLCEENPLVCLNVEQGPAPAKIGAPCFDEDKLIYVTVDLEVPPPKPICAAQFFLEYDATMLDFISIAPGGGVFNYVLLEFVDEAAGTIDYIVGEDPGAICYGETGAATMATITFLAIGECKTDGVCFRGHNPPTRLGAENGDEVCPKGHVRPDGSCGLLDNPNADPCCTGVLTFDSTAPVVNCPDVAQFGNADCGEVTRNVTWAPITAMDNCDGDIPVTCTITHNGGWPVGYLLPSGGDFPPGVTIIDCSPIMDRCDNASDCIFTIVNSGQNGLHVDVELSATMDPGPLLRGIEYEVSDCGAANPVIVTGCADVNFGFPKHVRGHGEFQAKLPPGNYRCIEAWDPLHTLKSTCDVTCEDLEDKGSVWFASFKGTKDLSDTCHWLVGGNLNGLDNDGIGRIDILDYVTYLAAIANNPIPGADTDCMTAGPHGDINGDGIVNLADFSFILVNLFNTDKAGCDAVCYATPASQNPCVDSITVRELEEMGFGREARTADMDGNGVVDLADMALYLNGDKPARSVRGSR